MRRLSIPSGDFPHFCLNSQCLRAESQVEPTTARSTIRAHQYLSNSWLFCFRADTGELPVRLHKTRRQQSRFLVC